MNLDQRIEALRARNLAPVAKVRRGIRLENSGAAVSLYLYDDIGGYDGIMAKDVLDGLKGAKGGPVELHVNSGGGDIFEAHAIHNVIKRHPGRVVAYVDGIAASAASYILMACDEVWMEPNAQLMIHDGFGGGPGHPADLRETADILDLLSDSIAAMYAERAGGSAQEWRARMTATTWYNASQAVAAGLATGIHGATAAPVNRVVTPGCPHCSVGLEAQCPTHANAVVTTVPVELLQETPPDWFGGLTSGLKGLFG